MKCIPKPAALLPTIHLILACALVASPPLGEVRASPPRPSRLTCADLAAGTQKLPPGARLKEEALAHARGVLVAPDAAIGGTRKVEDDPLKDSPHGYLPFRTPAQTREYLEEHPEARLVLSCADRAYWKEDATASAAWRRGGLGASDAEPVSLQLRRVLLALERIGALDDEPNGLIDAAVQGVWLRLLRLWGSVDGPGAIAVGRLRAEGEALGLFGKDRRAAYAAVVARQAQARLFGSLALAAPAVIDRMVDEVVAWSEEAARLATSRDAALGLRADAVASSTQAATTLRDGRVAPPRGPSDAEDDSGPIRLYLKIAVTVQDLCLDLLDVVGEGAPGAERDALVSCTTAAVGQSTDALEDQEAAPGSWTSAAWDGLPPLLHRAEAAWKRAQLSGGDTSLGDLGTALHLRRLNLQAARGDAVSPGEVSDAVSRLLAPGGVPGPLTRVAACQAFRRDALSGAVADLTLDALAPRVGCPREDW